MRSWVMRDLVHASVTYREQWSARRSDQTGIIGVERQSVELKVVFEFLPQNDIVQSFQVGQAYTNDEYEWRGYNLRRFYRFVLVDQPPTEPRRQLSACHSAIATVQLLTCCWRYFCREWKVLCSSSRWSWERSDCKATIARWAGSICGRAAYRSISSSTRSFRGPELPSASSYWCVRTRPREMTASNLHVRNEIEQ